MSVKIVEIACCSKSAAKTELENLGKKRPLKEG
jgi:hypothetical protein